MTVKMRKRYSKEDKFDVLNFPKTGDKSIFALGRNFNLSPNIKFMNNFRAII